MSHPSNGINSYISCLDWWIENVRLDCVLVFVSREDLHSTVFPVRCPIEGVSAVFDNVSCYILSEVGPSLCRDLDNFSWPPKVKLYPLSSFVYFSRPSTTVVPSFSVVQPR